MKVIFTPRLRKLSAYHYDRGPSVDDQPNFINRDKDNQGTTILLEDNACPESASEMKKRWKKKKKAPIDTVEEEMPKESL